MPVAKKKHRIRINIQHFEKLAELQCTVKEIAYFFGVDKTTIERRLKEEPYKSIWQRGLSKGRIAIRRAQMAAIQDPQSKGHASMLIWLGKVFLHQKETQDLHITNQESAVRGPYQHPFVTEDEIENENGSPQDRPGEDAQIH